MRNLEKKDKIQLLIIVLVSFGFVLFFFFPDNIGVSNKNSYKTLYETKKEIEDLNYETAEKELAISQSIKELDSTAENRDRLKEKKDSMDIDFMDFELDIPSILINLEQKALSNNVNIEIGYDYIKENGSSINGEDLSSSPENASNETESNDVETQKPQEEKEENNSSDNSNSSGENSGEGIFEGVKDGVESFEQIMTRAKGVSIDGIETLTIPVRFEGTYFYVREYLRKLDELGMIEPSSIRIHSTGKNVSGSVILNVFHGRIDW